jgi:squalene-associated FAD-dependent desaturase
VSDRPSIVVVGGGLAGLAAAIRATDDGATVRLFEQLPRLGGATWSFTRDGLTYDNGQHVFMRCCTEYRAFLERIGSSPKVTLQRRMDVPVHRPGGPVAHLRRVRAPAPLHLAPTLVRYRHLRAGDRLGVVRTALALRGLDLHDATLDDVTFGSWLADHGASPAAIDALWGLVCLPTINLPASEASLRLAAKVFKTGLLDTGDGGDIGWSNVPLSELHADAAAAALVGAGAHVHVGARVTSVRSEPDGHPTIVVDGEQVAADAVIVAVPHHAVERLLPPGALGPDRRPSELGRSAIVNVHLLYDGAVMAEPFVAGIESPVQFAFDRTRTSGAPPGHQMIAVSLSAADEYLTWSGDDLIAHFTAEVARLLPSAASARVVRAIATREPLATFRGGPGSDRHRAPTHTGLPGVYLAGAWTATDWPATMEGAVRSGASAARAARDTLERRPARRRAAV